jgi:hypothetical protein
MNRRAFAAGVLALVTGLAAAPPPGLAQEAAGDRKAVLKDRVVAGGPGDFLEVRHLVLKGSNEEIGRALATIGRDRYQVKPGAGADRSRARAQRRYAEKNFPALADRMRGVAAAFGKRPDDDAWDFGSLPYLFRVPPGCSVVYYPPGVMADGAGVVSRNYDFTTGTALGTAPPPGELPCTARPYVVEMHPDRGYASLALYSYDLLSGVLDGVNSEGLTVALLADDELVSKFGIEPAGAGAVGLGVQQALRLLLDTCADAGEAEETLLTTKHYYEFLPVHYLVADRHGKAFVWEFSRGRNREHVFAAAPGEPLVTTNFSLHRHLDGTALPNAKLPKDVCPRYCALAERIAAHEGKFTADFVKQTQKLADATRPGTRGGPPGRTLWHALYRPERRAVQVSFYLRDEPDPTEPGKTRIVRSEYLEFALKGAK